ncbi:hypothetical protein bcgnr5398_46900 [Bacillus cereus]|nr:hypothetical protein IC5_00094 [Bacillus cereus AND1407]KFL81153.1 putative membrane protein [Bacillus cereus]
MAKRKKKQDESILGSLLVITFFGVLWKPEFLVPIVMVSAAIIYVCECKKAKRTSAIRNL